MKTFFWFQNNSPHGFDAIMEVNGRIIGVVKPGVYYRPHCFQIAFVVNKQRLFLFSFLQTFPFFFHFFDM